ncbi:MAG: ABC transporter permease [Janthinobacterium lividum]
MLVLAALWEAGARLAGSRLFPTLTSVLQTMVDQAIAGPLLHNLLVTMIRVACAFTIAMLGGMLLGVAMGRVPWLDRLLDSALVVLLNLPALVGIVLIFVWFGLSETTTVLAVALNKLPSTAVTMREGARSLDRQLLEMGNSFRVSRLRLWRDVALPQLYPYLFASARSGLALIWKVVLVAELLGCTDGVGFQIEVYFQLFDVRGILAYTLAFVLVVQLIEWAALQPLERRAARWR